MAKPTVMRSLENGLEPGRRNGNDLYEAYRYTVFFIRSPLVHKLYKEAMERLEEMERKGSILSIIDTWLFALEFLCSSAFCHYLSNLATFGDGHDLHIADQSNTNSSSYSRWGNTYDLPSGKDASWLTGQQNLKLKYLPDSKSRNCDCFFCSFARSIRVIFLSTVRVLE